MNDFADNPAQSLALWLSIATRGLVTPSRQRIQLEIEAHFADAVKSRLDEGLTQAAAEAAALQELGAPKAAAKDFRKRHLTEDEEQWLRKWLKSSRAYFRSWRFRAELCIAFFVCGIWLIPQTRAQLFSHHLDWPLDLVLAFYGVYVYSRFRFRSLLKRASIESASMRELLMLDLLGHFGRVALPGAIVSGLFERVPVSAIRLLILVILFVGYVMMALGKISLWRKLRNSKSDEDKGFETGSA